MATVFSDHLLKLQRAGFLNSDSKKLHFEATDSQDQAKYFALESTNNLSAQICWAESLSSRRQLHTHISSAMGIWANT